MTGPVAIKQTSFASVARKLYQTIRLLILGAVVLLAGLVLVTQIRDRLLGGKAQRIESEFARLQESEKEFRRRREREEAERPPLRKPVFITQEDWEKMIAPKAIDPEAEEAKLRLAAWENIENQMNSELWGQFQLFGIIALTYGAFTWLRWLFRPEPPVSTPSTTPGAL